MPSLSVTHNLEILLSAVYILCMPKNVTGIQQGLGIDYMSQAGSICRDDF